MRRYKSCSNSASHTHAINCHQPTGDYRKHAVEQDDALDTRRGKTASLLPFQLVLELYRSQWSDFAYYVLTAKYSKTRCGFFLLLLTASVSHPSARMDMFNF